MSHQKPSPVKLWGPMVLSAMVALSLNSYGVSANETATGTTTEPAPQTATVDTTAPETAALLAPATTDATEDSVATLAQPAQAEAEATADASQDQAELSAASTEPAAPTEPENSQPIFALAQPLSDSNTAQPTAVVQPQGLDSNAIINVQPVWDEDYKGQGTVVAVIDSGLDIEHDVLRISDLSTAKYKTAAEIEAKKAEAGITYGKWYNDKVVFGYNYTDVNEELKEAKDDSHGMHVSGIAVGNPSKEDSSGSYIYGVAPEAQLMFMRVFSDSRGRGTQPLLYARAIEDAVKLGADSINLSLGGANGSTIDVGEHIDRAIAFARSKGVAVVIAAGNDRVFGNGEDLPYASNPDYGVVGSPSTARDSISVASYNNTHLTQEVVNFLGMEGNAELTGGMTSFTKASNSRKDFPSDVAYDYVYVGLGKEEDFDGLDLTGKIALIKRGEITFADKLTHAKAAGAAGALVFNNTDQGSNSFVMSITDGSLATFPAAFVPMAYGEELAAKSGTDTYKIQFAQNYRTIENPGAGQMSDFTSWGVTVDGELKPDVTAPGGAIYSAINNGKYNVQDGTSMASPHVAGVVALMKQALVAKFPHLTPAELQTRIKQLLMSTAIPHLNSDTNTYTSPRQQGAGIVDAHAAIHSDIFLTGEDDLTSMALGNVEDSFTFTVRLHNTSDQARSFKYVADLNTDEVSEGRFTLKPRHLNQVTGEVTVEANSSVLVPITLDASDFAEELTGLMTNGYFLEGFVLFLDSVDDGHVVSIPFVGFRGDFKALPVLEKPVYDFDFNNGDLPFYMVRPEEAAHDELNPDSDNEYYTVLMTGVSEWDHTKGERTPESSAILGSYKDKEGRDILYRDENGKVQLILSPNGDNNRDAIIFAGVFLRNFDKLKIAVYKADDLDRANPVWESPIQAGDKNFWSGSDDNDRATIFPDAVWDGKDKFKNYVPDGDYKYVVTYYPQVPGAKPQETVFDLLVDTVQPALTTGIMDREARTFKPRPTLPYGRTALYREGVYYVLPFEELSEEDMELDTGNGSGKRFYIEPDENGVYHLPETDYNGNELGISSFYFFAENYGGNTISTNLSEYQESENYSAVVGIRLRDPLTDEFVELDFRYVIRNEQGEIVTEERPIDGPGGNLYSLPFGTYSVELILIDEDGAYLIDERTKTFTVTDDNSLHPVTFDVTLLERTPFTIDFDTEPPVGTKVYLVDQQGNRTLLPQARYSKDIFEKKIAPGDYTVTIELPEGYQATDNNFVYTVSLDATNLKELSLWAKGNLENGGAAETADPLPTFDPSQDLDGDGFSTKEELDLGTDPMDKSDFPQTAKGDQEKGGAAAEEEEKPTFNMDDDHDGDGFSTAEEMEAGTDPFHAGTFPQTDKGDSSVSNGNLVNDDKPFFDVNEDHDGDGFTSKEELDANTNPLDKNSFPAKKGETLTPPIDDPKDNSQTPTDQDKETPGDKKDEDKPTPPMPDVPKDTPTDKAAQQPVKTDKQPTLKPVALASRPTAAPSKVSPTTAAAAPQKASLPATGDQASSLTLVGATMTVLAAYYLTRRKRN